MWCQQGHESGRMQESLIVQDKKAEAQDDAALMRRIAKGDQRALQALMQVHLSKTVRLAMRIMGSATAAEDIAQEAFIRVWKNAARWEDPETRGAQFSTWLYRIVLNLCIDEKRRSKTVGLDEDFDIADERLNAADRLQQREQSARVRAALDKLPERQRAAFILCFYEEHSNKEAADLLGISVKAVESLLVRSRRTLRDLLQQERE